MKSRRGGTRSPSSKEIQEEHSTERFSINLVAPCRSPKHKSVMGNTPKTFSTGISCSSALESIKSGKLTTVASREELERYAATQELLSRAQSAEEASQLSRLSLSDSMEALAALDQPPTTSLGLSSSDKNNKGKLRSFRGLRSGPPKILEKIGKALKGIEKAMFPHKPELGGSSLRSKAPALSVAPKIPGGVLLRGCTDDEEHKQVVRQAINIMKELNGKAGLQAMGLEYRTIPMKHEEEPQRGNTRPNDHAEAESSDPVEVMTRLVHTESGTMITIKNRKEFIADGDMYDQVARLCQEYAQEVMIEEGDLEWVTVCEAGNNPEPIRALVSTALATNDEILDKRPTLLIATGKGRVRAGIFSRQHLMTTGLECSTAVPIIREANKREMNCVLLDPNVHGDRLGMVAFEKSMARVFRRLESDETTAVDRPPLASKDLFVLSHSQSGAQFARYLLEKSNLYVPHIRAVAFTDSTHNIQWTRDKKDLHSLLQSDKSVYFKVSNESPGGSVLKPLKTAGEVLNTDHFWEHRFGDVETRCAGTAEHSLTNWFARHHIWKHFDTFLDGNSKGEEDPVSDNS